MAKKKLIGIIPEEKSKNESKPKDIIALAKEVWGSQFKSISEIKIDRDDGGDLLNFYVEGDATEIRNAIPLVWENYSVIVTQLGV